MTPTVLIAVALVPVVAAYVVASFRDPLRWTLGPYAVSIPFSSLISIAPGPFGSVSSLLGLLLGMSLLTQLITTRSTATRLKLVVPVWLGFLALSGLSLFWSLVPAVTAREFAVLASLVLLFVALVLTDFDARGLRRLENALLLGGLLSVAYGFWQVIFLGGAPTPDGGASRFGNDLLGPNNQASALLLPLAIATGRALTGTLGRRVGYGGAALALVLGIILTGSRGGLLAAVVVLGVVLVFGAARRSTAIALGTIGAVLLAVLLVVRPGGIGDRQFEQQADSSGRAEIWAIGMHACGSYCLGGAGWGAFPTVYGLERADVPEARVLDRGTAFEAHNIFLLVGVELGLPGFLLLITGLGLTLLTALRLPRTLRGPPLAALLGSLLGSVFLSNFAYKFFWAVLVYVAVCETVAARRQAPDTPAQVPLRPEPAGQDIR